MSQTPERSGTGEVANESHGQAQATGRRGFQEHNRHWGDLAAKQKDWGNRMVGGALYQQTLMIARKLGNDSNDSKINSRKLAEGERGAKIGETAKTGKRYR